MSNSTLPSPPAGWYVDPWNPTGQRYWDGVAWTGHVVPAVVTPSREGATDNHSAIDQSSRDTAWNTLWIWLVVGVPVIPLVIMIFVPWVEIISPAGAMGLDPYAEMNPSDFLAMSGFGGPPIYILLNIVSWAAYGLGVFFAYRDHKLLRERGVQAPFHWAFAFLSSVYPIGRSVIVVRRTGKGWAPMWVEIVLIVVSVVVSIAITTAVLAAVNEMIMKTMIGAY